MTSPAVTDRRGRTGSPAAFRSLATQRVASLTTRQREVLDLITTGHPSKNIAFALNISQRTVENHRAEIARKTGSRSLSEVVHTAVCANCALMKSAQSA
jgi:two-component system CheB/CheR fusion protein